MLAREIHFGEQHPLRDVANRRRVGSGVLLGAVEVLVIVRNELLLAGHAN
jgi:hypothetical protein